MGDCAYYCAFHWIWAEKVKKGDDEYVRVLRKNKVTGTTKTYIDGGKLNEEHDFGKPDCNIDYVGIISGGELRNLFEYSKDPKEFERGNELIKKIKEEYPELFT